jgi:hypothetical protein
MKRMYLELTKFSDKQLEALREAAVDEQYARHSKQMRDLNPSIWARVPMAKCILQQRIDGVWLERRLTEEP